MSVTSQAVSFSVGAILGRGYSSTFGSAKQKAIQLGKTFRQTNKKLDLTKNIIRTGNKLTELKAKQGTLTTGTRRLNFLLEKHQEAYDKAAAGAKKYGISLGNIVKEQRKLSIKSKFQGMKAKGAGMMAGAASSLKIGVMGAVAGAMILAAPIKMAADFQQSMANVRAVTNATGGDFKKLTATGRALGRNTVFSANEAARGMGFLGMAGFKTNEIISAMPGMLDLAAAGSLDLAQTADISSNILQGFNLEAGEMNRVGDVMARTMADSNTDLVQLGEAMKFVAPVAAKLNISIEETAAVIGTLSNAGIQATMAGTTMRKMLTSISAPTSEGARVLGDLGVVTKDFSGNMLPFTKIVRNFQDAVQDMGNAEQAAATKAVFGERATAGMLNIMGQTGKINAFKKSLDNAAGSAKTMADIKINTLPGQLKILGSVATDLGISIGNILLPPITAIVKFIAPVLGMIGSLVQKNPILTRTILFMGAGLLTVTKIFPLLVLGIKALTGAIMMNPIGAVIAGIAIGAVLIIENWTPIEGFFLGIFSAVGSGVSWLWGLFKKGFAWTPLGMIINGWSPAIKWLTSKIEWIGKAWNKVKSWFGWGDDEEDEKNVLKPGSVFPSVDTPKAGDALNAIQEKKAKDLIARSSINNKKSIQDNRKSEYKIEIVPQAGQNSQEIAEAVMREIEKREQSNLRGGMYDYAQAW